MARYRLTRHQSGGMLGPHDESCVVEIAAGASMPDGAEPLPDSALLSPWRHVQPDPEPAPEPWGGAPDVAATQGLGAHPA